MIAFKRYCYNCIYKVFLKCRIERDYEFFLLVILNKHLSTSFKTVTFKYRKMCAVNNKECVATRL